MRMIVPIFFLAVGFLAVIMGLPLIYGSIDNEVTQTASEIVNETTNETAVIYESYDEVSGLAEDATGISPVLLTIIAIVAVLAAMILIFRVV
jgi:hypothetical protein